MGILSMGKTPRPVCDVCNKKVEQMDIEMEAGGKMRITVSCHGEYASFEIDARIASLMNRDTEVGRGFVKPKELNE